MSYTHLLNVYILKDGRVPAISIDLNAVNVRVAEFYNELKPIILGGMDLYPTSIRKVEIVDINKQLMEQLSQVLTYEEPENFKECLKWWEGWFFDKVPGDKLTIVAEEQNNIIGVTRFWKTPYCSDKWLIEGLEVIPPKRRRGIGRAIVMEGIFILQNISKEKIFVNIANENIASIKLHEGIGFKKISNGAINSYGDYRSHIDEYLFEKPI